MIEIRESFDWCFKISLSKEMRNKKSFYKFTSESSIFQSYEKKEREKHLTLKESKQIRLKMILSKKIGDWGRYKYAIWIWNFSR